MSCTGFSRVCDRPYSIHHYFLTTVEHGVKPRALYQLSSFWHRSYPADKPSLSFALALLRASAQLRDESPSLALLDRAVAQKKPGDSGIQAALETLEKLSARGDAAAAERLAALAELRGDRKRAQRQAQAALEAQRPGSAADELLLSPSQARAWQVAANSAEDLRSFTAALEAGASLYNDPEAHHQLATLSESAASEDRIKHLLKAAASGYGPAAYGLGRILYDGAVGKLEDDDSLSALALLLGARGKKETIANASLLALAAEWFRVALEATGADDPASQENAARGAIGAMLAAGDYQGCQDLVKSHASSAWVGRIRPIEVSSEQHPS